MVGRQHRTKTRDFLIFCGSKHNALACWWLVSLVMTNSRATATYWHSYTETHTPESLPEYSCKVSTQKHQMCFYWLQKLQRTLCVSSVNTESLTAAAHGWLVELYLSTSFTSRFIMLHWVKVSVIVPWPPHHTLCNYEATPSHLLPCSLLLDFQICWKGGS